MRITIDINERDRLMAFLVRLRLAEDIIQHSWPQRDVPSKFGDHMCNAVEELNKAIEVLDDASMRTGVKAKGDLAMNRAVFEGMDLT